MNLDDTQAFQQLDRQDMWGFIDGLPQQLQLAWQTGLKYSLPGWNDLQQVVVCGMGGSAIGADLLAAYAVLQGRAPVYVHRDYDLPAWAHGPETLVIASSHSGNTEETLSSFAAAQRRRCTILAVTTGGQLAQKAQAARVPVWLFEHHGQPRSAVGFSFGLLLAALTRLQLMPDPASDLAGAIEAMQAQQADLSADVPAAHNLAKRIAGQLVGRYTTVLGAGLLAPVARRWKGQISEIAKAWGQFEFLPEADHNTLAGLLQPEALLSQMMVLFLTAEGDHPRNQLRSELTRRIFMTEGFNTDSVEGRGATPLAQMWTLLHLGDYVAYYLAMAYGVDPTPVDMLVHLKEALARED